MNTSTTRRHRGRRLASILMLLVAGLLSATTAASAESPAVSTDASVGIQSIHQCAFGPTLQTVVFSQLDGRLLQSGANTDRIRATFQSGVVPANQIKITLRSAAVVTARKELTGENVAGNPVGTVATEGTDQGPNSMTRSLADLDRLFFLKAKAFGVMCAAYQIGNHELSLHAGQEVTITWLQD